MVSRMTSISKTLLELRKVYLLIQKKNMTTEESLGIYIELGYGALQSTRALCALHSIINFKS
jgi:hypothetical protein